MSRSFQAPPPAMSGRDWLLLLALGGIWGSSFFFARIAVAEIAPLVMVFLRVSIAMVGIGFFLMATRTSFRPVIDRLPEFAALSVLNNLIPFSLIFAGQTELGAGLAGVLNATTPFFTLIVAALATRDEKLNANKLVGVGLGIAGTALIMGPALWEGEGSPLWAKLALLGASVSYGCGAVFAKRFRGVAPAVTAAGQLSVSTVLMLPVAWLAHGFGSAWAAGAGPWGAALALGLLCTAFAYILFFRLLASAGATNASLVTLVVPVSAILLGASFLHERITLGELGGMAVIALGFAVIDGRLFRGVSLRRNRA